MQLFHINQFEIKGNQIQIIDGEIIEQCRKVLRLKTGDTIFLQNKKNNLTTRYELKISSFTDKIIGEIITTSTNISSSTNTQLSSGAKGNEIQPSSGAKGNEIQPSSGAKGNEIQPSSGVKGNEIQPSSGAKGNEVEGYKKTTMLIAMPNKREKAELIVQKLTEIGISNIYFRPAERSIIKERNEKKQERLHKIAKEALEQSRGRFFPEISFIKNPSEIIQNHNIIIFDKTSSPSENSSSPGAKSSSPGAKSSSPGAKSKGITTIGIIGPEGGLTPKDYALFPNHKIISLGENILRMETAAIIGAWILKKDYLGYR